MNRGWIYRDRVAAADAGRSICHWYAERHRHSSLATWQQRLQLGEIRLNGEPPRADHCLSSGDQLTWHRPPWQEEAVPLDWQVIFDNGDLLVINKPSGLPVLPAGGFLEHTLLHQLEQQHQHDPLGLPRPVHRLGRHTSGLLVCARQSSTRAWLSALLRESTAAGSVASPGRCLKLYRALTVPLSPDWLVAASRPLTTSIGRRPHPLLGEIWCAVDTNDPGALAASSQLTLLERRHGACLVEVAIGSGRPHQIRIHAAAAGAPLFGDPLYGPGGMARPEALPGAGGYQLHAHQISLPSRAGELHKWTAPLPPAMRAQEL